MAIIETRTIKRRKGRDPITVTGSISMTGRRAGSYPAGSFQLRHISSLILDPQAVTAPEANRRLYGSVRDPNTTLDNSVLITHAFVGSNAAGSFVGAGTISRASYIATGY